jgi:two-component system, NarL family, nitrate/nitrite response regulator NarL
LSAAEHASGTRIVIADDHTLFRKGLRSLLSGERGLLVVGEAADGDEAVRMVRSLRADVLLLDLAMPGKSGMDALAELASSPTAVRTIVLTAAIAKPEILKAVQLGAAGVVLKSSPPELLFKCVRSVMAGQHWIGREVVSDLVQALRSYKESAAPASARFGLTPRELDVTSAVVAGFSNKEIAKKYALSEETVKHHLTRIFDKVGASNRLELALFAVHHQLLAEHDSMNQ